MSSLTANAWGGAANPYDAGSDEATAEEFAAVRWGRVAAVALAFFAVFYAIEHDAAFFAGKQVADATEDRIKDNYIDSIEDGNATRKLMITGFGLGGLVAFAACRSRRWNPNRWGLTLLGGFALWTVASYAWSIEPDLTGRRLVASGLILFGSVGYARMLRPNELLGVSLLTFASFVGYSLMQDLGAGGRPWQADYRFGGTLHPNIQAAYCGMLCLSAFAFPARFGSRWVAGGLLVFGFVMLLQTQSRTSALAVIAGMLMTFLVRLSPTVRWQAAILLTCLVAAVTIVVSTQGDGGRKRLTDAILLGRTEQAGSLTGRVPLWQELSTYAAERPLTGHGYESFWTPDNIAAVMKSQKWALQSAHNAYFEVVLQLGWVGLLLGLAVVTAAANQLQGAYARTGLAGYAFSYGVVAFAVTNSLLESHFAKLKYPTVIALIGVLSVLAFFPTDQQQKPVAEGDDTARFGAQPPVSTRARSRRARPAAPERRRA